MKRALRLLRDRVHRRAYDLHPNHPEAALTLWALVDELDDLLDRLSKRRP